MALVTFPVRAQAPVLGVADPEAALQEFRPQAECQQAGGTRIFRDLLEANHWELADKHLTRTVHSAQSERRLRTRAGVVAFFTQVMKVQPKPIGKKLTSKIVSVTAEGDLVTVAWPREHRIPRTRQRPTRTTWFDMWRIKDGKADEHWDSAMKNPQSRPLT